LTGRRPFRAATPIALRARILRDEPSPPRSIEPAVPETLERVCLRCLAKRPELRYRGADEVGTDLRAYLGT
jgi:eukaryotic-like serine/threonine-protein kinase